MGGFKWFLARLFLPLTILGRDRRDLLSMGDALVGVERVLLVLPLEEDTRRAVLPQVFAFDAAFPRWQIDLLFLGGEVPGGEGEGFRNMGVQEVSMEDVGTLGAPRKDLVGRLKESGYGLVIDLSMDEHPFVPYLLNRSGIPLRMGVNGAGRLRSRFYNLMVRLQGEDDVMGRLASTLGPICRPDPA
ncbi:MAG: hypothetical protein R6W82_06605 [bacterium]